MCTIISQHTINIERIRGFSPGRKDLKQLKSRTTNSLQKSEKCVDQVLDYIIIPPNTDTEYNFEQEFDVELTKPGIKADLICMRWKKIVD